MLNLLEGLLGKRQATIRVANIHLFNVVHKLQAVWIA